MADREWEICQNLAASLVAKKNPPLLSSPPIPSMEDATVDILIDAEKRQWDHGMVDGFFAP